MIAGLVAAALVTAAQVSVTLLWLSGRPDDRAQAIVRETLSATTSFHWTLDAGFQGDCFVRAARACADDAGDLVFCGRCVDPMVWAHLSQPRLVGQEFLRGIIPAWHLAGQPVDGTGVADVWIGYDHHPLEALVAPDLSERDTFQYSCFNGVHPGPRLQPADRGPGSAAAAAPATCSSA